MPPVTITTHKERLNSALRGRIRLSLPTLRKQLADILSCEERQLAPKEVDIAFLAYEEGALIGDTRVIVYAAPTPERVTQQDIIAGNITNYFQKEYPELGTVKTWLVLAELGYSFQKP